MNLQSNPTQSINGDVVIIALHECAELCRTSYLCLTGVLCCFLGLKANTF